MLASPSIFAQAADSQGGFSEPLLWIIYIIVGLLLVVTYLLYRVTIALKRYVKGDSEEQKLWDSRSSWEKIFQLKPTATDKDTIIDEPHDGIYELDNPPPPWFMFLFYATIAFAAIYFVRYSITGAGMTQEEEYLAELQELEQEQTVALEEAGAVVDENTVVALTDAASIESGKKVYVQNCKVCHDVDARGSVGPNLTDEYWINGGGAKNIFKTIKYGVVEKGMRAWEEDLPAKMIQDVTSYIISLEGTNPEGAKEPQGEIWVPEEETSTPAEETSEEVTEAVEETTAEG